MDNPVTNFRAPSPRDQGGVLALSIYLGFSLLAFGRQLPGHFRDLCVGTSAPDTSFFMWLLVWWPHALTHRLNPLFPSLIWAPVGFNLAWSTSIPLPALVMWPITSAFGPIAAFNVMALAAPALAAWSAFLLCRHISGSWLASLLGGYIFGFSAHLLLEQYLGHPCLTLVFLVPLAGLVVARAIEGGISNVWLFVALAAILVAQFLISVEVFATMTMFGAMALYLGWQFGSVETARRIARITIPISAAYVATIAMLTPYFYYLLVFSSPTGQIWPVQMYSVDLLAFVFPGPLNALGKIPLIAHLSASFRGSDVRETDSYMSLPLILIALAYASSNWRATLCKVLTASILIISVLAMGPRLHVLGTPGFTLPGKLLFCLPLIDKALPERFTMYSYLALAIIVSLWFASNRFGPKENALFAAIVVFFMLPNLAIDWTRSDVSPAFFAGREYQGYIAPGENVLVIPFGSQGESMLWQAETNMYFRLVGGWTGLHPAEFSGWPIFPAFTSPIYLPDAEEQLQAFMAHYRVDAAVVADGDSGQKHWEQLFSSFASHKFRAGGVTVYRVLRSALLPYQQATPAKMRQKATSAKVDSLLLAAGDWLSANHSLAELTGSQAFRRGMLRAEWCVGPDTDGLSNENNDAVKANLRWFCGVRLGGLPGGHVAIGLYESYAALEPAVAHCRHAAAHIYFPYPNDLLAPGIPAPAADKRALMDLVFDRDRIAAVAAQLRASPPP